jgi:beta-galactosidase
MKTFPVRRRATLAPTLGLFHVGGAQVPFQNRAPLRSFDPQDHPRTSLAGTWRKLRFAADHDLTMARRDARGLARLDPEGLSASMCDDSGWAEAVLPGVENRMPAPGTDEAPERYEDGVWYRRRIGVPADWTGRFVTLNFLAANYVADVWLNGRWIGWHEGGYTPFSFDVSAAVRPGAENSVAVRIDNPPWGTRSDTIPSVKSSDWWNYTGIIQEAYLESQPAVRVVRADIVPMSLDGTVSVRVVLSNASPRAVHGALGLRFFHADPAAPGFLADPRASAIIGDEAAARGETHAEAALAAGETRVVRLTARLENPRPWSPGHPDLYVMAAELTDDGEPIDRWCTQFGVRTVAASGTSLLLNGAPVILAGIARHEEWPDTGRTARWDRIRTDLEIARELGASFLRTAHYPNHPFTYLLTDRLGLLVMQEVPAWQFTDEEFRVQGRRRIMDQMWREMVLGSFNRPSVILWGAQNEGREVRRRRRCMRRLFSDWRTHYPDGRLSTQSAAADSPGPLDASQEECDVAGWTVYFGIFHGSTYHAGTADFLDRAHRRFPGKPVLATEFGLWSYPDGRNNEEQRAVFRETFRAFSERLATRDGGFVAGMTWWTLFDWFSVNTGIQSMGLCGMDRVSRKPVWADAREAYGRLRPVGNGEGGPALPASERTRTPR